MKNKKELIIIFVVSFLIIAVLFYICFNKIKSNSNIKPNDNVTTEKNFIYRNLEYKVPSGYEYVESNKLFLIYPTRKEKWTSQILFHNNLALTNINEIYNQIEQSPTFIEHTLKKVVINGTNVLIYKYTGMKKIIADFFTPSGELCQIFVNYETNEFDINTLTPIIESINNPVNLGEVLKSTTTTQVAQNN